MYQAALKVLPLDNPALTSTETEELRDLLLSAPICHNCCGLLRKPLVVKESAEESGHPATLVQPQVLAEEDHEAIGAPALAGENPVVVFREPEEPIEQDPGRIQAADPVAGQPRGLPEDVIVNEEAPIMARQEADEHEVLPRHPPEDQPRLDVGVMSESQRPSVENEESHTQRLQQKYKICADCWHEVVRVMCPGDKQEVELYESIYSIISNDRRLFGAKRIAARLRRWLPCLHSAKIFIYLKPQAQLRKVLNEINPALSIHERLVFKFRVRERFGSIFQEGFFTQLMKVAEDDDEKADGDVETELQEFDTSQQLEMISRSQNPLAKRRSRKRLMGGKKHVKRLFNENLVRIVFVEIAATMKAWKESSDFLDTWKLSDTLLRMLTEIFNLTGHPQMNIILANIAVNLKKGLWYQLNSHFAEKEYRALFQCLCAIVSQIKENGHLARIEQIVRREMKHSETLRPHLKGGEEPIPAEDGKQGSQDEPPTKIPRIRHRSDDDRKRYIQQTMVETQELLRQLREEL